VDIIVEENKQTVEESKIIILDALNKMGYLAKKKK